jgi:hypothetical protein
LRESQKGGNKKHNFRQSISESAEITSGTSNTHNNSCTRHASRNALWECGKGNPDD